MGVKLPWKVTIFGWVLLGIQVIVMGALYLDGGGRIVALEAKDGVSDPAEVGSNGSIVADDYRCLVSGGPPYLAIVVGLRAAVAVCAQVIVFGFSDRGLLKPHEAMWLIFAFVISRWLICSAACCVGAMHTQPVTRQIETRDGNGNVTGWHTETDDGGAGCLCCAAIWWMLIPLTVFWFFTGRTASINLSAVCELTLDDGNFLYWFSMGSLSFVIVVGLLSSCYLRDSQFARTLVAIDSVVIGITSIWGNYVQSGVVAGVFGLLPAFNLILQCIEWRRSGSTTVDEPDPASSTV